MPTDARPFHLTLRVTRESLGLSVLNFAQLCGVDDDDLDDAEHGIPTARIRAVAGVQDLQQWPGPDVADLGAAVRAALAVGDVVAARAIYYGRILERRTPPVRGL